MDDSDTSDGYACSCNVGYTGNDCQNGKQFLHIGILVSFNYISNLINMYVKDFIYNGP